MQIIDAIASAWAIKRPGFYKMIQGVANFS